MLRKNWALPAIAAVAALAVLVIPSFLNWLTPAPQALAQDRPGAAQPGGAREVTLSGRVVDLHCFMTGQYPSADRAKCTADCIRNGVPAGLETPTGVVVFGQGTTGPAKTLLPLAYEQVEATGKLYEKAGVKYLDIASLAKAGEPKPDQP